MKNIDAGKACQLRRLILTAMLVASGVLLAALTLIIIGAYDNYQARLAVETVLNRVALGQDATSNGFE